MKTLIEKGNAAGAVLAMAITFFFMGAVTGLCLYLGAADKVPVIATVTK